MTVAPGAEMISNSFGDTCAIYPYQAADSFGQPTYGSPRVASCRVLHKIRRAFKPDGEIASIQTTEVYLNAADTIAQKDKIVVQEVGGITEIHGVFDHEHTMDGKILYKKVVM